MTARPTRPRIQSFDALLAALLVLTLGAIGLFAYRTNPRAHRDYVGTLLAFEVAEGRLTEDLYRLQTGALLDFDALVSGEQTLRRLGHQLDQLPGHVGESPTLNKQATQLTIALNQKLDSLEAYKTTLAAMNAAIDTLPALADEARSGPLPGEMTSKLIDESVRDVLRFVYHPDTRSREMVQTHLAFLRGQIEGAGDAESAAPLRALHNQAAAVLAGRDQLTDHLRAITSVPLDAVAAQMSFAYHRAHQESRLRAVAWTSLALAAMIVFFVVLTYVTRWRTRKQEAAIAEKQEALSSALKEARAQTATLQKDEAAGAVNLAENRLSALLQNTFEVVAIISREENYIFASPAVETMLGLTEKELIGRSVYEGIHADDLIRVQDYFTRAQKELQTERTVSYRLMDAYGKWHMVETFASNQYSNPAIRGMVLNTRRLDDTQPGS